MVTLAPLPQTLSALDVMRDAPVIPVIVIHQLEHAVPLAKALVAGGIRMLEVTLRTPVALEAMRLIANEVPEAVLGAGTVRSVSDLEASAKVGARFFVSPGYTKAIGLASKAMQLPLLPGVATGSEIMQAQEDGLTELKFFPAMQAGGLAMLKAWGGPFTDIRFCPTGGLTPENVLSAIERTQQAGQQHADQMPAGRAAADTDVAGIATIDGDVAHHPGKGLAHLVDDVVVGHMTVRLDEGCAQIQHLLLHFRVGDFVQEFQATVFVQL